MESRPWHAWYEPEVPTVLDYPAVPLDALLRAAAQRRPGHPALVFFGRPISYRHLDGLVDRLTAGLQDLGVGKGDRVAVLMPNCPQAVISLEAIWRAGAIAVPASPLATAAEFRRLVDDAGARHAICISVLYDRVTDARPDSGLETVIVASIKEYLPARMRLLFSLTRERRQGHRVDISGEHHTYWFQEILSGVEGMQRHAPAPVEVHAHDTAALMSTGGTTGVPKAAELSHGNLVANALQVAAWAPGLVEGREVVLTALPLSHSYALTVAMNHAIARSYTQVLVPDPRDLSRIVKTIHAYRPTVFPGVPALYAAVAGHPDVRSGKYDVSSINYCISGAAGLAPEIQRRFTRITGARLVEGYGLSEASPVTHCNPLGGGDRVGTIGVPLPGTDCRILDQEEEQQVLGPGERGILVVSGPQVMEGYWNRPEDSRDALRTDDDGTVWLHTGDVAVMDPDGFFRIVDRKKDVILASGGLNVYPREVEDVLVEHPAIAAAGVIGVPPGSRNQRVKAFVALNEGATATELDVIDFCRARLAAFKVPQHVEFRDELPQTFVGKVLRRDLAAAEESAAPGRD